MKLKTFFRKAKKANRDYFYRTHYRAYYEKYKIKEDVILLESQRGGNLNGNIFYLLRELKNNDKFKGFHIYLVYKTGKKEGFKQLLTAYNINHIDLVRLCSKKYYKLCAEAKYLINDTSFLPFFIKKEGQVILNTWHGTPLKCLGKKDNSGYHNLGNVQRNFIFSDYLLYPNYYMRDHMIEDYMLSNLTNASYLMAGYPRNESFFNKKRQCEIKSQLDEDEVLDIHNKKIYAYMPTWRGTVSAVNQSKQTTYIMFYLYEIDRHLTDDEIFYVNLHPFIQDVIDYNGFRHIKPFPKNIETYEFLSIADVLVTDYSSVFYDFANSERKIVLFAYDKEEYFENRGVYEKLENLPFPIVEDVKSLVKELREPKMYDDSGFIKEYCSFDRSDISKVILEHVILKKKDILLENKIPRNNKDNVLMYVGNMAKNGITTSLMSLLNSIDLNARNYYVTFTVAKVRKNKEAILSLPDGVNYLPMMGVLNANLFEKFAMMAYRADLFPNKLMQRMLDRLYKEDIRRYYYTSDFKNVIQFNGYEYKRILEFARFDANRIIYVHNNMEEEIRVRRNQHPKTLKYAYNEYDKIAIVTKDMAEPTLSFCHDDGKLCIVNNTIDYLSIRKKGDLPITFDQDTICKYSQEELITKLDDNKKTFITVGRFSPEKGHLRLLDAFHKVWEEDKDIRLIIIGGHGVDYIKTVDYAESLPCSDNVIIIKSMSNPQPVLRKCNYFILSSYHEGLGLVLMEADIQGLPVVSTDILGPRGFLQENGGLLVENNTEGLISGIRKCLRNEVQVMGVDYQKYNENAVMQFENLLI